MPLGYLVLMDWWRAVSFASRPCGAGDEMKAETAAMAAAVGLMKSHRARALDVLPLRAIASATLVALLMSTCNPEPLAAMNVMRTRHPCEGSWKWDRGVGCCGRN